MYSNVFGDGFYIHSYCGFLPVKCLLLSCHFSLIGSFKTLPREDGDFMVTTRKKQKSRLVTFIKQSNIHSFFQVKKSFFLSKK